MYNMHIVILVLLLTPFVALMPIGIVFHFYILKKYWANAVVVIRYPLWITVLFSLALSAVFVHFMPWTNELWDGFLEIVARPYSGKSMVAMLPVVPTLLGVGIALALTHIWVCRQFNLHK